MRRNATNTPTRPAHRHTDAAARSGDPDAVRPRARCWRPDPAAAAAAEAGRQARIAAAVADDSEGHSADWWAGCYPAGAEQLTGPTSVGCDLSRDLAVGARPTPVRPGAAVSDLTCGADGPGVVVRVTATRCVTYFPATGRTRRLTWHEVVLDHVAPDPAFLPAPRPATRRRKGGAPCGH